MSKRLFWSLIGGILIFAVLAATRALWMDVNDLSFLRTYIAKVNILPKEKNVSYEQACASCHMLYAPSMLPSRSWDKMMKGLNHHFGDNAEVEKQTRQEISEYLQRNSADHVENIYSQGMKEFLRPDDETLRISETKYFKLLHDVVKPEMVSGNLEVRSIVRCEICHHEALEGRFNKFNVRIPNYIHEGQWRKIDVEKTRGKDVLTDSTSNVTAPVGDDK